MHRSGTGRILKQPHSTAMLLQRGCSFTLPSIDSIQVGGTTICQLQGKELVINLSIKDDKAFHQKCTIADGVPLQLEDSSVPIVL